MRLLDGFLNQTNISIVFFLIMHQLERKMSGGLFLVFMHHRVNMAVAATQLSFVVVLTVNTLIVPMLFTVPTNHVPSGSYMFVIF